MLYPIPVPAGSPPWLGLLLLAGGIVVFVVVVWQAVRYFRSDRGAEGRDDED